MRKKIPIRHICFDLDGTLVNSFDTILNSTIKTLKDLNIGSSLMEKDLRVRIGHHFSDIFKELKIDVTDIEHFISIYKENYFDFIHQSELYPFVKETLSILKQNNLFVSLLTTKGQDQAEKIIEHFKLTKYFDYIMGRRIDLPVKPNPEPLIEICRTLKVETSETLMTGDTELDIICGKRAESLTCAVTYGYREKENLLKEEADFYIDSLNELIPLLNKKAIAN
ncbi:MAG TPA: HAD family hydrolase [Ignavibacteriaceae bacterium]|nr:HAD family hydrolase [Ignavibacteriaceae bacterium]